MIAVGHFDGSIELLSAADLHRVGLLRGHGGEVYDSLFSRTRQDVGDNG